MTEFYVCAFCLEVHDCEDGKPPLRCTACKVVRCKNCETWIKDRGPLFCYGCGEVKPEVEAVFTATYQTAIHFLYDKWHCRNRGPYTEDEFGLSRVRRHEPQRWVPVIHKKEACEGLLADWVDVRDLEPWETDYLYPKEDCEDGKGIEAKIQ